MNNKTTNILIVGVGGQGVILASELLLEAAMYAGYDVKKSEVHGMAQRGGVVSSHVRFGPKVYSPLIPFGQTDVLLAFEAAEGLRWVNQLKPEGALVINTQRIIPPIAYTKDYQYPKDPIAEVKKYAQKVIAIDAEAIAQQIGNVKMVNVVLLGAIADYLPLSDEVWETIIKKRVPKGTEELNLAAFKKGRELVKLT